ncbi:cell surface protein [Streptomyces sp. UNOB3_S3]|uniref:cell surface protein n=1 Tax=Streptomyces sp. UNOB3_S3 TaxID=2871682 RepID=UPI001E2EE04B|nr:cell surface protein [Streptomyces sp. UNOB3_S3]MCC3773259.1 cell surface protein [Streptomyces sp. UNOB3_S3]
MTETTTASTDLTPAGINAAFSVPDSGDAPAAVYMIRGGWAVQYDAASTAPPRRGTTLRELWPQLPATYLGGVDATCSTDTQRVYFFKGSTCVLYDIAKNEPVGGAAPVQIGDKFPGLRNGAPDFTQGVDAGMAASDGTVYLFRGGQFVNYDLDGDEVLEQGTLEKDWANASYPDSEVYGGVVAAFNHPATRNGYLVAPGGTRSVECDTDPDAHRVTSGAKALRDRWLHRTFLSVLDGSDGRLWVFDADSGQRIRQSQVGVEPGGVVISPDGFRTLSTAKGDGGGEGNLALLDITAGTLRTVGAGVWPYRVTVLPDGSAAYVTNPLAGTAHAIDLTTGAARSIDVGPSPDGIVASPEGDRVYVATDGDPVVAVVDPTTNTVGRRFGGPITAMCTALTPDGNTLCFGIHSGVNAVAVAMTAGAGDPPLVPVGQSPEQLAPSPDAAFVYVANRGHEIKVIDVQAVREVTPVRTPRDRTNAVAVSPDGGFLFVTSERADSVQKLPVNGGDPVAEFPLGAALGNNAYLAIGPAWG